MISSYQIISKSGRNCIRFLSLTAVMDLQILGWRVGAAGFHPRTQQFSGGKHQRSLGKPSLI
jgi:hypothetical protein